MGQRLLLAAALGCVLLLGATAPAAASTPCEIWFDEFGRMHFNCNLADLLGEYELDLELSPPCCFRQPDLDVDQVDWEVFSGPGIVVNVDTLNNGDVPTREHTTVVAVTIIDPHGERPPETQTIMALEPMLAPGPPRRTQIGTITVPNRTQEWFLTAAVVVDPPTPQAPSGAIFELDESNNTLITRPCRILTQNSGNQGPIPCN